MIIERVICGRTIVAECAPDYEMAALDILLELEQSATPLEDGNSIWFGWSRLTLRKESEGLRLCEPNFSGDAEQQLSPTLDSTIAVVASQLQWLRRTGVGGVNARFDQNIVLTKGVLLAQEIFALRTKPQGPADSGWSIAPVPPAGSSIAMNTLEALLIYRLVTTRPGLLACLAMPVGTLVTLSGNEVIAVTAPRGRRVEGRQNL